MLALDRTLRGAERATWEVLEYCVEGLPQLERDALKLRLLLRRLLTAEATTNVFEREAYRGTLEETLKTLREVGGTLFELAVKAPINIDAPCNRDTIEEALTAYERARKALKLELERWGV